VTGGVAVRPLDRLPALALIASPQLDSADAARVEAERRRLATHRTMFDGPILMVRTARTDRIEAYPATYAWHRADRAAPLPATIGGLGVQLALVDDRGALLWQRRSHAVEHPGVWTVSVAGCAAPEATLEDQIVGEAGEELGLERADLLGLTPLALVEDPPGRTVQVVFRAQVRPGAEIRPRPAEVAEIRFAATFPGDGFDRSITARWWPQLVRLATGYG
jgi:ADP-ribose pyrophosphatase YjhB (NUDIX family)